MNIESSLTTPSDRDTQNRWRPEQGKRQLTENEVENAMEELNNVNFTSKFPRHDRVYADPAIAMQVYGLISFVPSNGATPDKDGVYGFAKMRGNYATELEASERAEYLIRNHDSYHQIYHTYVGRPFPVTVSSEYSKETDEIDIRKKTTESMSSSVKSKKQEEKREINEIKDREKALLDDSKNTEEDPYEEYITLRVKKAQLQWTYLEHQKKIAEIKEILIKTRQSIEEHDERNPEFQNEYFEKYKEARRNAGIDLDKEENTEDNFMKFLVEDADLGF